MTAGQIAGAGVIAVAGQFGYPAFAVLYAGSAALRVLAYRRADPVGAASPVAVPAAAHRGATSTTTQSGAAEAGASAA